MALPLSEKNVTLCRVDGFAAEPTQPKMSYAPEGAKVVRRHDCREHVEHRQGIANATHRARHQKAIDVARDKARVGQAKLFVTTIWNFNSPLPQQ